jgi:hypothetical protein
MIRKVRVSRELVEEIMADGYEHTAFRISCGIPKGHKLFKVDFNGETILFWFGPQETTDVDDSLPRVDTFPFPKEGEEDRG